MKIKTLIYKVITQGFVWICDRFNNLWLPFQLWMLNVQFHEVHTTGLPFLQISGKGRMIIGRNFSLHNGAHGNPIGFFDRCTILVEEGATLKIGNNVGISQCALIANTNLTIGDNVKIGGGTHIYTSDFHSLNPNFRADSKTDRANRAKAPVNIGNNVFIGTGSIVLKGVTIGDNSIIGAGSVVSRSVPANEIWAGNPARKIRDLDMN